MACETVSEDKLGDSVKPRAYLANVLNLLLLVGQDQSLPSLLSRGVFDLETLHLNEEAICSAVILAVRWDKSAISS